MLLICHINVCNQPGQSHRSRRHPLNILTGVAGWITGSWAKTETAMAAVERMAAKKRIVGVLVVKEKCPGC